MMNSASRRTSRGLQVLQACIVFFLSAFAGSVYGTVTYNGKNGVASWLAGSAAANNISCIACHNGSTAPDFTTSALAESSAPNMVDRLSASPSTGACMPQGYPCGTVSSAEIQQWISAAYSLHAAPTVNQDVAASTAAQTAATSLTKTGATLNGSVNANGLASSYWFEWGLDDGGANFPNATSHVASSDGAGSLFTSNGGLYAEQVSSALSGLTCGTHYQFRIAASNGDSGSPSYGSTQTFQTASCNFPGVSFGGAQVTGVGSTLTIPVSLTGDGSTDYQWPIVLHYQLSGTANASDYTLSSGTLSVDSATRTITIASPATAGDIKLEINGNSQNPADGSVTISLDPSATANATVPDPSAFTAVISGSGVAPVAPMQVSQGSPAVVSQFIYQNQGTVTVTANGTAGATYDWSATDARLVPIGGSPANEFRFDPASLATGSYVIAVAIDDGTGVTHHHVMVVLGATPPTLSTSVSSDGDGTPDATEGRGDVDGDGLPNYLDPTGDPTLLNESVSPTSTNLSRLITTTSGLSLALNDAAIQAVGRGDATGAKIPPSDVPADSGYSVMNGVYDFQVRGLSASQRTAQVVIPLDKPLPSNAVYRKLMNGAWVDFTNNGTDSVRSAASVSGACPAPGDGAYRDGLNAFDDCLELTLTDGGPNDEDGEANGVIRDPGAVVTASTVTSSTAPPPTEPPGGAGVADGWWLAMMIALLWVRRRHLR